MNSPLLNGKLNFDAKEGIGIGFNRKIHELQTDAVILYNAKNQNISTELRKKIAPNLLEIPEIKYPSASKVS